MRLSEPIEEPGFFWTVGHADNLLPGVLRISKSGTATVEVFGPPTSLFTKHKHPLDDPMFGGQGTDMKSVMGIIGKNKSVTLDGCFVKSSNSTLGGLWNITIHANRVFIGVAYKDNKDIKFSKIEFVMEGFDEWLGISGIHVDHRWNEKSASIHFHLPQEILSTFPVE